MTVSPSFEYEIQVPDVDGWGTPAKRGTVSEWSGTAHNLGRDILKEWQADPPEQRYAHAKAIVEVRSDHGARATVEDSTAVGPVEQALEESMEAHLVADLAYHQTEDSLIEAMRDGLRFGGLSKNKIAERVSEIMSRPTAYKHLKGVWRAEETYDLTIGGPITYDGPDGIETVSCPNCKARDGVTVFGSPAGDVHLFCPAWHRFAPPAGMDVKRLLKQLIDDPDVSINCFRDARQ
ncbi:hypothetical protein [Streptomyces sp. NPDC047097]|uniref:hypothetical protein n=1 Tax=Streptomyces sp. NPDC047097 TaxID=3155260 RepID=UPI0033F169D8